MVTKVHRSAMFRMGFADGAGHRAPQLEDEDYHLGYGKGRDAREEHIGAFNLALEYTPSVVRLCVTADVAIDRK